MNGREALSRVLAIASEALDEAGEMPEEHYPYEGDKEGGREQHKYDSECLSTAGSIVWRIEADEEY